MDSNIRSDLTFIKSIMIKSEFSHKIFRNFFFSLSLYSFISGVILSIIRLYVYSDRFQSGNLLRDVLMNTLAECGFKLIMLIPILTLVFVFRKKVASKNQGISLWIFDIASFVIIFCGSLLPFTAVAVSASYEVADLFSVMTAAVCMLLCGVMTDNRELKICSYIYLILPMAVLFIFGIIHLYNQFYDAVNVSEKFVMCFGYIKAFSYVMYPSIGYGLIALSMHRKGKCNGL